MTIGRLAPLVIAMTAGCGAGVQPSGGIELFPVPVKGLVLLELRGESRPPSGEGLSWSVFSLEDSRFGDSPEGFLFSADSAGKLLLLIQQEPEISLEGSRQHIQVVLDQASAPVSVLPEGVTPELEGLSLSPDSQGQSVILGLFEKYRPDIAFISVDTPGRAALGATVAYWRDAALTKDFRLAVFSPPGPGRRGWCALAWRGLEPGFLPGLSYSGFLKSMRIVTGLPWDHSASTGIPAAAALTGGGS
jgi:hypothetical protein